MAKAAGITTAARTERLITRSSGSLDLSHWRRPGRELLGAGTDGAAAWVIGLCHFHRGPRCRQADGPSGLLATSGHRSWPLRVWPDRTSRHSNSPRSSRQRCASLRSLARKPSIRASFALICRASDSLSSIASWRVAFCSACAFLLVAHLRGTVGGPQLVQSRLEWRRGTHGSGRGSFRGPRVTPKSAAGRRARSSSV